MKRKSNPIINMLLKVKNFYLLLTTKIKSLFQKQDQDKYDTVKVENNQQYNESDKQFDSLFLDKSEERDMWFDAEDKLESEVDEDEFFDALSPEEFKAKSVTEDEGYISSSSQDESIAAENITIEKDQYYHIDGLQKAASLSSYGDDTLALAFGGEAIGKITNAKHNLASLHYDGGCKSVHFVDNTKGSNLFLLEPNSFNIYMPSYFENNQSKFPKEAFGDSQVVILLQKPKSVNLPPKNWSNRFLWWSAGKFIGMKNNPIKICDDFPFDFISFSYSNGASISQFINRKSPKVFVLSLIDDISSKQEKIDWKIKGVLVRGDCISLTKELVDEVPNGLENANVKQISSNHRSCVSL